jgi:endonuclease/exonuclease/phosphatase (EEP) superfamily protein YafD
VIDWILVSDDWHFVEYDVIPSLLSDHRMVVAEVIPAVNAAVPE